MRVAGERIGRGGAGRGPGGWVRRRRGRGATGGRGGSGEVGRSRGEGGQGQRREGGRGVGGGKACAVPKDRGNTGRGFTRHCYRPTAPN